VGLRCSQGKAAVTHVAGELLPHFVNTCVGGFRFEDFGFSHEVGLPWLSVSVSVCLCLCLCLCLCVRVSVCVGVTVLEFEYMGLL